MAIALIILQSGLFILTAVALIAYIHFELVWSQLMEVIGGLMIIGITCLLIWKLVN